MPEKVIDFGKNIKSIDEIWKANFTKQLTYVDGKTEQFALDLLAVGAAVDANRNIVRLNGSQVAQEEIGGVLCFDELLRVAKDLLAYVEDTAGIESHELPSCSIGTLCVKAKDVIGRAERQSCCAKTSPSC